VNSVKRNLIIANDINKALAVSFLVFGPTVFLYFERKKGSWHIEHNIYDEIMVRIEFMHSSFLCNNSVEFL